MTLTLNPDGLALFAKRACPTCALIESQIQRIAEELRKIADDIIEPALAMLAE